MTKRLLWFVFSLTVMVCGPVTAHAWSDAGHKIIAAIAWRQLQPRQRQEILDLLSHHPRYAEDFVGKQPENLADASDRHEWLFLQASVWPDMARGLPDPLKERFHHSTWHYINHPLYLSPADKERGAAALKLNLHIAPPRVPEESMNIVQTIRMARRELAQRDRSREERAVWLTWLFHTVGDMHQPLHATTFINIDRLPDGDRGGNSIQTKQRGNLHALWDGFPGGRIQLNESRSRAIQWMDDPEYKAAMHAGRELNEEVWWRESRHLSDNHVYDEEVRAYLKQLPAAPLNDDTPRLTLSEDYLERSGRIARLRVIEAGYRLGAILNELYP
jgi:hypothetical protein